MTAKQPDARLESADALDEIYVTACDNFRSQLSPTARDSLSGCSTVQELLQSCNNLDIISKSKRKALPLIKRISNFANKIEPYQKAIEILCASHAEWFNIPLGAFRLVLTLASNFTTFFEKLTKTIERLTALIPQYEDVLALLNDTRARASSRLRQTLSDFFIDLLTFFGSVARVFTSSEGKARNKFLTANSLLWKPFDIQFDEILSQMKFHRDIIKDEVTIAHLDLTRDLAELERVRAGTAQREQQAMHARLNKMHDQMKREHLELLHHRLLNWLKPPAYKEAFERHLGSVEDSTAEWLSLHDIFTTWLADPAKISILWVHGNPGSGKSVLAASTTQELMHTGVQSSISPTIICYYFFSHEKRDAEDASQAYRALLAQVLHQCREHEEIMDAFTLALQDSWTLASTSELQDLLGLCFRLIPSTIIMLDGLDECLESHLVFRDLSGKSKDNECAVKLLIFSRPHLKCLRQSKHARTISMSRTFLDPDIKMYLQNSIQELQSSNYLPADTNIESVVERLLERSEGMFLWARLMITYLNSPALSSRMRLEAVQNRTPDGLNGVYFKIISLIASLDTPSRELAKTACSWVAHARSGLTPAAIEDAHRDPQSSVSEADKLHDGENAIITSCAGLLEKRQDGNVYFIHLTVKELFLSQEIASMDATKFVYAVTSAAPLIAMHCLYYLLFSIPAQPLTMTFKNLDHKKSITETFPLLRYAATQWSDHCISCFQAHVESVKSPSYEPILETLDLFLRRPLSIMAWIEILYTLEIGPQTIQQLSAQLRLLTTGMPEHLASRNSTIESVLEFSKDLISLDMNWAEHLKLNPGEIWNDITAFSRSKFFQKTAAVQLQTINAGLPLGARLGDDFLFDISKTSADLKSIAVLSIWPNRSFADLWKRDGSTSVPIGSSPLAERLIGYEQALNLCSGWKAFFEVWDIRDEPRKVSESTFPIEPEEVRLQMKQSLRFNISELAMSFPMRISESLTKFTILRTAYLLSSTNSTTTESLVAETIKFDTSTEMQSHRWRMGQTMDQLPYRYRFAFSADENFVLFHDLNLTGLSTLIAYNLNKPKAIRDRAWSSVTVDRETLNLVLHPHDDLALLVTTKQLCLWSYSKVRDTLAFIDLPTAYKARRPGNPDFQHDEPPLPTSDLEIGFSQCGRFYTMKHPLATWPDIRPIPLECFEKLNMRQEGHESHELTLNRKRKLEDEPLEVHKRSIFSGMPVLFRDSMSVAAHDLSNPSGHYLASTSGPNQIELHTRGNLGHELSLIRTTDAQSFKLLTLPAYVDIRERSTAVSWAPGQEEKIQIILNKTSKQRYNPSDKHALDSAAHIVKRDIRSIQPMTQPLRSLSIRTSAIESETPESQHDESSSHLIE